MSDTLIYVISIIGGFLAGIINTLAGNGSVITLGILTEVVGLPANIANGTNRIGILFQGIASYAGLRKNVDTSLKDNKTLLIIIFVGAILGGITASVISNESFRIVYRVMMVVMLFTILAKPSRWIKPDPNISSKVSRPIFYCILLLIGFYGGFIQMGMGLLFLAVLVLLEGKQIMEVNLLKVFIVTIFTLFVLAIFVSQGLVNWKAGLIIAIGQATGGWVAGNYISRSKKANTIAYYTLVFMIMTVLVKMFFF